MGRVGHEEVVKLKVRWKTSNNLSRLILSFHVRRKNEWRERSKEVLRVGWTRVRLGLPKTSRIATTTTTMSIEPRDRSTDLCRLYYVAWELSEV